MSLKEIKEASNAVAHDSTEPRYCTKCRLLAEIAALEKAAKVFGGADVPNVLPREEAEQAWEMIQAIAKEAE